MKTSYLLDTHTLLWFLSGDKSLSTKSKSIIDNTANECFVSIVSIWEIAIKINLNKLSLDIVFEDLGNVLLENDIGILQISFGHLVELMKLEDIHSDPFDRIIIAQCKNEQLQVISKDKVFRKYSDLKVVW
jgi:PIN domain nuclease of toxin-antitoxin system